MILSIEQIITITGIILGAFTSLLIWGIKVSARLAKAELKIDTIWNFQMRRARIGIKNSGIDINDADSEE